MRIRDRPTLCLQHELGCDVFRGVFGLSLATVIVDVDDIELADGPGEVPHARGVGLAQDAGRYAVAPASTLFATRRMQSSISAATYVRWTRNPA